MPEKIYPIARFESVKTPVIQLSTTWANLVEMFKDPAQVAIDKESLPLFSGASFKGSERTNDNVTAHCILVCDYDKKLISIDEAAKRLSNQGVKGVLYHTPGHEPGLHKWRMVSELLNPCDSDTYLKYMELVNGIFDGDLDGKAATPSQPFYFGHVLGNEYRVIEVPGNPIDDLEVRGFYEPITPIPLKKKAAEPETLLARCDDFTKTDRVLTSEQVRDLKSALAHLAIGKRFDTYAACMSLGGALSHYGDIGYKLWRGACALSDNFEQGWVDRQWKGFNSERLQADIEHIFKEAGAIGWVNPLSKKKDFEVGGVSYGKKNFLSESELSDKPKKFDFLVEGLFVKNTISMIVGKPGSGKTYIALDMAYQIACGGTFAGRQCYPKGKVAYICGEGFEGFNQRRLATRTYHGKPSDMLIQPYSVDLNKIENVQNLIAELKGTDIAVLFVDTLNACYRGSENDSNEIGRFIEHLNFIKKELGCSVVVLHHTGRNGEVRGSSALDGAMDMMWEVSSVDKGTATMSCKKSKDLDYHEDFAFNFRKVDLGVDEESGEIIQASLVTYAGIAIKKCSKKSEKVLKFENDVLRLLELDDGISEDEIVLRLKVALKGRSKNVPRDIESAFDSLVDKDFITEKEGKFYLQNREDLFEQDG